MLSGPGELLEVLRCTLAWIQKVFKHSKHLLKALLLEASGLINDKEVKA